MCRSCVQLLSRCAFNFVAVAQFGLPISEQVAKIHHRLAVCSCDLHPFYSCCYALNKLDSSANEIYGIQKTSGPLVVSSLHLEHYSPGPFGLLNPVDSMASEYNYYIVHSSHTLQSSLLLPSPDTVQMATFFTNSKKEHRLQQLKKIYNRLQSLAQAHPTMYCILQ